MNLKICGKPFSVRSHLTKNKFIHRRAKPYHCGVSGKSFSRNCGLTKHKCTHTAERKQHLYGICGKSF
ncbi:---NA--- [Octopus vulgaris]|uniref:---NA n=1 Tax=Octopus vulgaris TaxID=6645 RepID=A0AA36BZB7_OCTVU|nr:---NA--- [Octopus vulgaris]